MSLEESEAAWAAADLPEPGQIVDDKYRLGFRIGEGGMGVVFQAIDIRLGREVAIKLVQPDVANDAEHREMLLQEARSMARIRHPNVVEIYDVGQLGPYPFIVMPYHRGADLADWAELLGGPPVATDVVVGVLGQVCAGLDALHRRGLVHGDIKPSNILVSEAFEVAITDFGLARRVKDGEPDRIAPGTPGFVAPELVALDPFDQAQAHKVDVYSLGVTAYWLLTGSMPFLVDDELSGSFDSPLEVLEARPPSAVRSDVHTAFDGPVLRTLARDPRERPDVMDLRAELFTARERSHATGRHDRPFVVVVDDNEMVLRLLERVVRDAAPDADVVTLQDPESALAVMESRVPALVISDLQMPKINGLELVAALRGYPLTRDVPVVVISGVGGADDWKLLSQLGVHRFLLKPVAPDVLRHVVGRLLDPSSV